MKFVAIVLLVLLVAGAAAWQVVFKGDDPARHGVTGDLFRDGILSKQDSAQQVNEWSAGVNWFPVQNIRVSLMYTWVGYNGDSIRPLLINGKRIDHEDVLLARFQVDF